jgi:HSP20 family protein
MTTVSTFDPFRAFLAEAGLGEQGGESAAAAWIPAVDIYETENELVAKIDLPGVNQKDLDVRVENNTLTIRGERKFDNTVSEENYVRVERAYGTYSRSFSLPPRVNTEAIGAEYTEGVLTLRMPKREEAKPKQIHVNVATNGN